MSIIGFSRTTARIGVFFMGEPYRKNGSWAIRVNWVDYTKLDKHGKPTYCGCISAQNADI